MLSYLPCSSSSSSHLGFLGALQWLAAAAVLADTTTTTTTTETEAAPLNCGLVLFYSNTEGWVEYKKSWRMRRGVGFDLERERERERRGGVRRDRCVGLYRRSRAGAVGAAVGVIRVNEGANLVGLMTKVAFEKWLQTYVLSRLSIWDIAGEGDGRDLRALLGVWKRVLAKCAKEREQKRVMFWKDALKLEHMTTRQQCPSRREEGLPPLRPGRCAAHKEMPRLAWGETGTAHSALPYLLSPFDLVS
ncbi:hypothetical protein BHM03_00026913 [Ensete ventricosum]|nr:hypothetical protein BHM03_00026913 [Ensete ventricosum]